MDLEVKEDLYYTKDHEWIRVEDGEGTVGLADFAQNELGDIVFVEMPREGDEFDQKDEFAVVESVKAVADIYIPVSGTITEVNEDLLDQPELVNDDPYGEGWFVKLEVDDEAELDNLMQAEEYEKYLVEEEEV